MTIREEKSEYAPHACPRCGEAAYIGGTQLVECTNWKCVDFHEGTWESHVMSLPDTGDPEPDIEDDEPTDPQLLTYFRRLEWEGDLLGGLDKDLDIAIKILYNDNDG